jgi:hypothetical protein
MCRIAFVGGDCSTSHGTLFRGTRDASIKTEGEPYLSTKGQAVEGGDKSVIIFSLIYKFYYIAKPLRSREIFLHESQSIVTQFARNRTAIPSSRGRAYVFTRM